MKRSHVARFEEIVQRLVEGTFARLFAGRLRPTEVANALAHALEDHAVPRPGGLSQAPNRYYVTLHPEDHRALLAQQPRLADDLAKHLIDLARELGFAVPDTPVVYLRSRLDVPLHEVRVTARWVPPEETQAGEQGGTTRQMKAQADVAESAGGAPPTRPFLILEGHRHIPLVGPTVTLGRSLGNDIILDDARVSRRHAQLRRRYDRYVVYDLGSSGGTTVNGYPVQECVLEAGDVISLAGVEIIYGEDMPAPSPSTRDTSDTPALRRTSLPQTGELPPQSSERSDS